MSWLGGHRSSRDLYDHLRRVKTIKSQRVYDALLATDRGLYCPGSCVDPYHDSPSPLFGCATVSAPHMHAMCLELLKDKLVPGCNALDIGSGSGYLTVVMSMMIGSEGKVWGVDHIQEIVDISVRNVNRDKPELLKSKRVEFLCRDGRQGLPEHAPFDWYDDCISYSMANTCFSIHVGAAASSRPDTLMSQLSVGGVLVCPVRTNYGQQALMKYTRNRTGELTAERVCGVSYVPLTEKQEKQNDNKNNKTNQ